MNGDEFGLVVAVIPAFNEEPRVGAVVAGARAQGVSVLVVDDGSHDGTAAVARAAGADVLRQPVNRGKGAALRAGFEAALARGARLILTLDADGQHDPAEILAFLEAFRRTGIPVLVGNRMGDPRGMPWTRRWVNRWMSRVLGRRMRRGLPDTQNGFRLFHASVWPAALPEESGYAAESEMLLNLDRQGVRMDAVPVRTIYATERSRIRPVRDAVRFLRMLRRLSRRASAQTTPHASGSSLHPA